MIVIAVLGGLLAGVLIAVAWSVGCWQGRREFLALARALGDQRTRQEREPFQSATRR
jgi:hypothetical protein